MSANSVLDDKDLGLVGLSCDFYGKELTVHFFDKGQRIRSDPRLEWINQFSYPLMYVTNQSFPTSAFIYSVLERKLGGHENKAGLVEFNF